jgi:hypothetical protein
MNKVYRMPKPLPSTETERTEEAQKLIARLTPEDTVKLTTWEVTLVAELREGKAATRIRLKDLREAVHRIYPDVEI